VPAERIAQNLAFINWTVLTALSVGAFGAVVLARARTDATRGFLTFTTACALIFGLLAFASDGALPPSLIDSPVATDPGWSGPRHMALVVFCVVVAVYFVLLLANRRSTLVGLVGLVGVLSGVAVLGFGALGWGGGLLGAAPLLVQLAVLTAATGGVFAAMILGHWYLVTPRLPEAPLVLFSRVLTGVIALQVVLFVVWVAIGAGPQGEGRFAALVGPWALFVWLRLLVGLVFPLVVSWAAVKTASTRSMESATGLLYINVGSIAAGTILAAGLYFGAGLLV
jgi:hypothetical protein